MELLEYKKVIGFTKSQQNAFKTLESYGVNVNQFVRIAISEKIKKDWRKIKEKKDKIICPF